MLIQFSDFSLKYTGTQIFHSGFSIYISIIILMSIFPMALKSVPTHKQKLKTHNNKHKCSNFLIIALFFVSLTVGSQVKSPTFF